MMKRKKTKTA